MTRTKKSTSLAIGQFLMQIALAALLLLGGIRLFMGQSDMLASPIIGLFSNSTMASIFVYFFAIIEVVTGALLLLDFLHLRFSDKVAGALMLLLALFWIVDIIIIDFIPLFAGHLNFMGWLHAFCRHLILLAAFLIVRFRVS